jgi:hypothetical protein
MVGKLLKLKQLDYLHRTKTVIFTWLNLILKRSLVENEIRIRVCNSKHYRKLNDNNLTISIIVK